MLLVLIVAVLSAPLVGKMNHCLGGKEYSTKYHAVLSEKLTILQLEKVDGLLEIVCNVDESNLLLVFDSAMSAEAFGYGITPVDTILTAGSGACNETSSAFLLRVLDFSIETFTTATFSSSSSFPPSTQPAYVVLSTAPAKYTQVFQNASISFGSTGNACTDPEASKNICLGVNTNKQCNAAQDSIPIYSNEQISVTCSDCYIALDAELFFQVNIELFYMTSFSGGFNNVATTGSLVVDLSAQDSWSVGVDKTFPIVSSDTIVDFWIGPVPIHVSFSIPLELQFSSSFQTSGSAQVGASLDYDIGGLSVAWDWKSGWSFVKPNPTLTMTPVLSGEASFNAVNTLQLTPSFIINADSFFYGGFTVAPTVSADTQGNTQSNAICTNVSWDLDVTADAELDINIPWFAIHKSKTFGPYTIYNSGNQNLPQFCVDV